MRSEPLRRVTVAAAGLAVAGVAFAATFVASCSSSKSFIVLDLQVDPSVSTAPLSGVESVQVEVTQGAHMPILTYPYPSDLAPIDAVHYTTLSVNFSGGDTGDVTFFVRALDGNGCYVAQSDATVVPIKKDAINSAVVFLKPGFSCPADAGVPDGGTTFPGCDPASPGTGNDAGVVACMSTQTCTVDCTPPNSAPPRNECVMAGSGGPGASCPNMNADCQPGTQCFDYTGLGCGVKVCLKYCNDDADCAAFGAGGGGPGSVCQGPVQCPGTNGGAPIVTRYHTCTFNCDPGASAAATRGGCPTGLACVMAGSMDAVDCTCTSGRTKQEGASCSSSLDCAPGLLCNEMGGTKICRAVCRCDAAGGVCTAAGTDCPTAGTHCNPTTNNTRYGVCL
jgi:hypothetical protein